MAAARPKKEPPWWVKWLLGILATLIVAALIGITSKVLANTTDIAVQKEVLKRVDENVKEIKTLLQKRKR